MAAIIQAGLHAEGCNGLASWGNNELVGTMLDDLDHKLLWRLERHPVLRLIGFTFAAEPSIGIVVARRGHVRGFWRHGGGGYNWTPAGYGEPQHLVENEHMAVSYTLEALAADPVS
jgi:hypothetical protein